MKSVGFQYCPFYYRSAQTLTVSPTSYLLTAPNTWSQMFRTYEVADDDMPRQYMLRSVDIDWVCQCENGDVGNLWLQVMVVSLKTKMANQVIERTTRLSQMEEGLDYIAHSAGTQFALQGQLNYKLNPALYTVHYNSRQRRIGESTATADPF